MTINIKKSNHLTLRTYQPDANPNPDASFPAFLTRISSASTKTLSDPRPPITYKKGRKHYEPMSLLQLLEWEFMTWTGDNAHNFTLHRDSMRDIDFVQKIDKAYGHAYL